jgi:hypothetical protein
MPGDAPYSINNYNNVLQYNKGLLNAACDQVSIPYDFRILLFATAMIETTTFSCADRDNSKDYNGNAANVSMFNLSIDLIQSADPTITDPWTLNNDLDALIKFIQAAIKKWGLTRYLNFVRGGRTAFIDGFSYGAYDYRNAVKTIINVLNKNNSLLYDDRSVSVNLQHV